MAKNTQVISTGAGQADLTLEYQHHEQGRFTLKDLQVATAEFIGTFFLALIIGATKVTKSEESQPIAIGFGLVALVFVTGPISGGQLNPAVTIGLYVRNKISALEAAYCIVSQCAGAAIAGLVCYALYGNNWSDVGYPKVDDGYSRYRGSVAELLQTFALVTTVLNTATTSRQKNNSYYGVAIGFVVLAGAIVEGSSSGACFNPAIALLSFLNGDFRDLWVFFVAPSVAGALAGAMFRVLNPEEVEASDPLRALSFKSFFPPDSRMPAFIASIIMEFIGTFYLVYTIALTSNASPSTGFIAIGAILTSMVFAGGPISGAHYNPAVSLGLFIRDRIMEPIAGNPMTGVELASYVGIQLVAGFAGGGSASYVVEGVDQIATPHVNTDRNTLFAGFIVELLFSFFLVLTVLNVATMERVRGNSYYGLAIGFVVLAGVATVADISGGVFNPAVGIALPTITDDNTDDIWVYVIGPLLGAPAAAVIFMFWNMDAKTVWEKKHDSFERKETANPLRDHLLH